MRARFRDQASALERDLELAERVYRSLLPKRLTAVGIDVVTRTQPFNRIGGDYATVFPTPDGRVFVCVSDVTAHGTASALLVTRVNSFVRECVPFANHPCEVVQELNSFLCDHFGGLGLSLSFFCGVVDLRHMEFSYAGCGHPAALHFKASPRREWEPLKSQHTLLGMFSGLSLHCRVDKVPLNSGEKIFLYTDGLTEARDAEGNLLGVDGLAKVLTHCVCENLEGELLADRALEMVKGLQGMHVRDDVLLMVISIQ